MKTKYFSFLSYNLFEFGDQHVSQFIVFESKYLFSIIFFYFHKSSGCQDRFHTHAFNALSFRVFGNYIEEFIVDNYEIVSKPRDRSRLLYIPKNSFHRITKSDGCLTILLSGRWEKTWKEYVNGQLIIYNWNRHVLQNETISL